MAKLSVNVNKIATLRNTRPLNIPDVRRLAAVALDAGAHGITIHPRPDQRHIRPVDVYTLTALVKQYPGREFNIEGNPFHTFIEYAREVRPDQCTLVPDTVDQPTSDHGWNTVRDARRLKEVIAELKQYGCRVSLFVDADVQMVQGAAQLGADRIELYTEPYAAAFAKGDPHAAAPYAACARAAVDLGLGVNAGHDLNLENLPAFIASVPQTSEVSIGHALIADALEWGLAATVKRYIAAAEGEESTR